MARASTATGLSIDEWAAILGIDPWSVNNCNFPARKAAQCEDTIWQFGWQKDRLSREEIAEAIASAESMIAHELLYWPYPCYSVDEDVQYPRPHQRELYGFSGTIRGEWKTVQLVWHKFISGGVFNRTFIGTISGADLTFLDEDGDGIEETFQAVITDPAVGALDDPYELALYFGDDNRHGEIVDETWRIRPLTISITGDTATIRGHKTLLVNPQLEFGVGIQPFDPTAAGTYVDEVLCYRAFTDDTATEALPYQGVAKWKNIPDCTQDCTFSIKELCLGEHNNPNGRVFASFGEPCTWPFQDREPDRLSVNYVAGEPYINGQIPAEMAKIITYLSVSLLANEKCGCERSNRILAKWCAPILRFEDNNDAGAQAFASNRTPFPNTVGGQYAWARVKRMRDQEVVSV